jgi:hypothetical protein
MNGIETFVVGAETLCYKDGVLHNPDGPARKIVQDGRVIYEEWRLNGEQHRDGDKPAVTKITFGPEKKTRKEWWVNGEKHRDGGQPAVVDENSNIREWWIKDCIQKKIEEKNGYRWDGSSEGINTTTFINNKISSIDDKPAISNGRQSLWCKDGVPHRDGGEYAFITATYPLFNAKIVDGVIHSDDDTPACIVKHPEFVIEMYVVKGKLSRKNGPAFITYPVDEDSSSENRCEIYMIDGVITRDDGPAIINSTYKEWWKNGLFLFNTDIFSGIFAKRFLKRMWREQRKLRKMVCEEDHFIITHDDVSSAGNDVYCIQKREGVVWKFSRSEIHGIFQHNQLTGQYVNPYTTQQLPSEVIAEMMVFIGHSPSSAVQQTTENRGVLVEYHKLLNNLNAVKSQIDILLKYGKFTYWYSQSFGDFHARY